MKLATCLGICALVVGIASTFAVATQILSPVYGGVDAGSCYGSWAPLSNAFDTQPTWDGTKPVGGGVWGTGKDAPYGEDKWGFVDLGADFSQWRIEQGWTYYRKWSGPDFNGTGIQVGTDAAMWCVDNPGVWPAPNTRATSINQPTVKFNSANPMTDYGFEAWAKDFDVTGAPIIPQTRYLILHTPVGTTNRAIEYAIVGYKVPEPATMILLGAGALALIRRRK